MAELAESKPGPSAEAVSRRSGIGDLLRQTEVNLRVLGMVLALVVINLFFGFLTNGRLLEPANIVALAVQAATIAIIATGMVLVIVSRNIDLSVGSLTGVVAMSYALLMTPRDGILPAIMGFDHPMMWIVALLIGIGIGAILGGFQGFLVAYVGIPSFVVTLGGLLAFRGFVWIMSGGATVSGVDPTFQLLGGGPRGSIGGLPSWIVGVIGALVIIGLLIYNRRQRVRFGFPLRPRWADALIAVVAIVVVLGLVAYANAYLWPTNLARQYFESQGLPIPPGGPRIESGIPYPILLIVGVVIVMHFIATRLRFGRSVFAYGGNPEAAELAGINTRRTIMLTFVLMGVLCAIAAAIAAARLGGATLDVGRSYELYVIAAAVIGGTSFAGGIGTVPGAVLGALVMQSLTYGLQFIGLSSPVQDIAAGGVLVLAVGLDAWNRRRST